MGQATAGGTKAANSRSSPLVMLARQLSTPVIASGGVASLDDLRRLQAAGGIAGVITGRALYDGRIDLKEASIVGKQGGLTLSSVDAAAERAPLAVRPLFDIAEWQKNQAETFVPRLDGLIRALAQAEPDQRPQARLDLARFYMAHAMYYEAKGEIEAALADANPKKDESITLMIHAVASILIDRPDQGLKDLANPVIGSNYDSQMWQALALARQQKWADAREKFKNVEFAIASLPLDRSPSTAIAKTARPEASF